MEVDSNLPIRCKNPTSGKADILRKIQRKELTDTYVLLPPFSPVGPPFSFVGPCDHPKSSEAGQHKQNAMQHRRLPLQGETEQGLPLTGKVASSGLGISWGFGSESWGREGTQGI